MTRIYIWEDPNWPHFSWDADELLAPLGAARRDQGAFQGMIQQAGFREQQLVDLEARTEEATGTSEIEGEPVSRIAVRSSIARRLHVDTATIEVHDPRTQGLVDMTLDATLHWENPLTVDRLHQWHRWLAPFPTDRHPIPIGRFRDDAHGPMQVVSGQIGNPTVHFQAPPAERIPAEIDAFLTWFNGSPAEDGLLRSAIAHLWFVTIHPYEDGNGRVARAIADLVLSRDEKSGQRFFSVSRQINCEKSAYYDALERTQKGTLDITGWHIWFLDCYTKATSTAHAVAQEVLRADAFWRKHMSIGFSERQRHVLDRYMHGFEGKLTAKKWALLTKSSHATASRDIADLLERGVLKRNPGGSKNTSYSLVGFESTP